MGTTYPSKAFLAGIQNWSTSYQLSPSKAGSHVRKQIRAPKSDHINLCDCLLDQSDCAEAQQAVP